MDQHKEPHFLSPQNSCMSGLDRTIFDLESGVSFVCWCLRHRHQQHAHTVLRYEIVSASWWLSQAKKNYSTKAYEPLFGMNYNMTNLSLDDRSKGPVPLPIPPSQDNTHGQVGSLCAHNPRVYVCDFPHDWHLAHSGLLHPASRAGLALWLMTTSRMLPSLWFAPRTWSPPVVEL